MKNNWLKIIVFLFFIWLSWACGIADAFVADEIDSIKDSAERARAWQVEYFYQEHGRYPTDEERAELFGEKKQTEQPASEKQESRKEKKSETPLPPAADTRSQAPAPAPPASDSVREE